MYRRYTRRLCTKSTHGSWSVRWLFSRTGYVSLFSPWPSCSCSIRVFIIWPASSVTVIRGTISAGSNFGVGRSHEPKYPAARKRPFCGLCSVGVISGERHSLYFLLHSPFSVYARLQRWFSEILPTVLCSHCYTAEREGERERGRRFRRSRRYSSFGISVRPSRIRQLILVERSRLRRFSAVRKIDRIKFLSQVNFPIAIALTLQQAN